MAGPRGRRRASAKARRRFRRYRKYVPRHRSVSGPPKIMSRVLTYSDMISVAPGASTYEYCFRGTSLYDPDKTSTGHQPLYYDQYATLFGRYKVNASRITLTYYNSASIPTVVTIVPHKDDITFSSIDQAYEMPRRKGITVDYDKRIGRVSHFIRNKQMLPLAARDTFVTATDNNPTFNWHWNIFLNSFDEFTNITGKLKVQIKFYCQFLEPIDVSTS